MTAQMMHYVSITQHGVIVNIAPDNGLLPSYMYIISEVLRHWHLGNITGIAHDRNIYKAFTNYKSKMKVPYPRR